MGKRLTSVEQLTPDQIAFITNKVAELGSRRNVGKFYDRKDVVSTFARQYAETYFESVAEISQKQKSDKSGNVKRKRKIVVDDEDLDLT